MGENAYFDAIGAMVGGKDVLDVGSMNHSFDNRERSKDWVHDHLRARAGSVVGIDILKGPVLKAQAAGYDIRHGNAETWISEDRTFDVVFAGDLIEHLSNPGAFLACAFRNLRDDGRLVLVTPNTYGLRELFLVITRLTNDPPVHQQHTFYFTPTTLTELARRHGFEVVSTRYVNIRYRNRRWSQRVLLTINRAVTALFPTARQTIVMEFKKAAPAPKAVPKAGRLRVPA